MLIVENLSSKSWNDASQVTEACDQYLKEAIDKIEACKFSADFDKVIVDYSTFCEVVNNVLGMSEEEVTEMGI